MVTMAQSAVNWRNTHTHVYRTHSLTHSHQHSYNHVVRSASSAITESEIESLFSKGPEGWRWPVPHLDQEQLAPSDQDVRW